MERSKAADEKLQMFFDGELTPEEEAAVRQELERSSEGASELREWETIEAMQQVSRRWTEEIDSDALFARIQSEIGAPAQGEPEQEGAPAVDSAVDSAAPVLRVVPGGRERRIWGVVATGFAAAAAIFLAVMTWPAEPTTAPTARGTEVLEVDFGPNAGTIFNVEGGAGESLAVVWIDDEQVGLP